MMEMGIIAMNDKELKICAVNTFKFAVSDESIELNQKVNKRSKNECYCKTWMNIGNLIINRLVTIAIHFPANAGIGNNKDFAFNKLEILLMLITIMLLHS